MRRSLLLSVIALGGLVTLMGAAGIFAVFTDRATTGTNTVSSGERPASADLKIASTAQSITDCQTFQDNLTTGLYTATGAQPGTSFGAKAICLKNAGSATLNLSTTAVDLTDSETGCTGDEQAAGDATCGSGVGELSPLLFVDVLALDCSTGSGPPPTSKTLAALGGSPISLGSLASGAQVCVRVEVRYPGSTPDAETQKAQSDSVTWRFAFDGTTSA